MFKSTEITLPGIIFNRRLYTMCCFVYLIIYVLQTYLSVLDVDQSKNA